MKNYLKIINLSKFIKPAFLIVDQKIDKNVN